jgi:hypothetical protein
MLAPLVRKPVEAIPYGLDIRHLIRCIVNNVLGHVVLLTEEGVTRNRVLVNRNSYSSILDFK